MAALSNIELYQLYQKDRVVVHTIPAFSIPDRPPRLLDEPGMLSGTILFHGGLQHHSGANIRNAVARFGDKERVRQTVFATLHDLDLVWATHWKLELDKPAVKRATPFLFFTNCDMCDPAKASGGLPCSSYLEAQWQVTPPVQFQRPLGFDFRRHCEECCVRDDPSKHALHPEWNELRAALNSSNQVGLMYIHDPACNPGGHQEAARELHRLLGPDLVMAVFALDEVGGATGNLVVEEVAGDAGVQLSDTAGQLVGSGGLSGRVVSYEEYLVRWQARQCPAAAPGSDEEAQQ